MEACTKCGGTGQYVPNSPNMFNCELGGDCSELDGWDKEQCKTCGYTACDCEAGQIWDIWQRKTWKLKEIIRDLRRKVNE